MRRHLQNLISVIIDLRKTESITKVPWVSYLSALHAVHERLFCRTNMLLKPISQSAPTSAKEHDLDADSYV